jgi:hypothetical protein
MTSRSNMEDLFNQIVELPDDERAELVAALIEMRAENLGIYVLDDDDRAALDRSAEDVRLGRFASDEEMDELFARYGA